MKIPHSFFLRILQSDALPLTSAPPKPRTSSYIPNQYIKLPKLSHILSYTMLQDTKKQTNKPTQNHRIPKLFRILMIESWPITCLFQGGLSGPRANPFERLAERLTAEAKKQNPNRNQLHLRCRRGRNGFG